MLRRSSWLVVVLSLLLQSCESMPTSQSSFSDEGILLDQVNSLAQDDDAWFDAVEQSQQEIMQRFSGEVSPSLAFYLERELHIHDDDQLSAYLLNIIDRLLTGWKGVRPDFSIVIESDDFFTAYVTEHHQLHISTGVFRRLNNEDQLASLLAHELSHILLKHNHEKSLARSTLSALEFGELLSADVGLLAEHIDSDSDVHQGAEHSSLGFSSLGFVWADIFSPNWSRENELEADKLGMDLVMRAGYNYEEFPVMIENVFDAQMGKSGRLKQVSEKIDEVIQDNLIDTNNNQWEAIVEAAKVKMAIKAKDMIINEIALNTKEYEDSTTRIEILKQYVNNEYDDDLPPEITAKPYKAVIDGGASKARLKQDLEAVEVLNALNNEEFDVAKKKATGLKIGSKQDVISGVIAKSLVEAWNKNARVAANYLTRLTKNNVHAPAEAYTKLAEIYIAEKKYSQAEEILELGIKRIGRDYKFLPTLIYLKVADNKTEEAENYTLECQKYDNERKDSLILSFFANSIYYEKCASILGYDVRAKNNPDTSLIQDLRDLGAPITEKLKMPFER